ncbi:MAG: phage head-tail connector protein [Dorea sp.]|nr:phage head-tail connector protein [Dorea sp.]
MLKELKNLLGLELGETDLDDKLNWILGSSRNRLKNLLGGIEPPEDLEYIIIEVSAARFNRIGSEGMAVNTVEGESLHFSNSDFAGYMDEINAFLTRTEGSSKKGGFRFI